MLVKLLKVFEYDDDGEDWWSEDILDPTWEQIEPSIRRLDKWRYPFVWLLMDPAKTGDQMFDVMGGESDYWIAVSAHGYKERQYCDPNQGEEEIDVWLSDQGFSAPAKHVCHDIEVVLRAARHFCVTGGFDPLVPWE